MGLSEGVEGESSGLAGFGLLEVELGPAGDEHAVDELEVVAVLVVVLRLWDVHHLALVVDGLPRAQLDLALLDQLQCFEPRRLYAIGLYLCCIFLSSLR